VAGCIRQHVRDVSDNETQGQDYLFGSFNNIFEVTVDIQCIHSIGQEYGLVSSRFLKDLEFYVHHPGCLQLRYSDQ